MTANRLGNETSPYLRQHADNPVDWYPWGDEAFALAEAEDRPVFLSIGYSACHWCHVMAHESFEDAAVAATLNATFVPVKVDREERPDVDAVYMEAVLALTGSGGWPMSVFLTPDRRPFFGGTYFPAVDRPGLPSFTTVLAAVDDIWRNRRPEVEQQADELADAVASRSVLPRLRPTVARATGPATRDVRSGVRLEAAVAELADRFDGEWGGFGPAPKFPQPTLVDIALRHALRTGSPASLQMATRTLDAMAAGGIHDHLGGGFSRYSTDAEWLVPHFEKMLYDQAGLLAAFIHGWAVTGDDRYLGVAEGIVNYVLSDLAVTTTGGTGLCSAEDADSEGVEGRFYVWTPAAVADALASDGTADGPAGVPETCAFFDVSEAGNFEGMSILRRPVGAPLTGDAGIEEARRRMISARSRRTRPGLDDKVLAEWNAMFASALAEAAALVDRHDWADAAESVATFVWEHLRRPGDGRLLRSWQRDGGARHLAYAVDHAWLVDCCTRLAELTGKAVWTARAVATADALLELFGDPEGGFFTTGGDAEALIVRPKDVLDGATPSANGVAAVALARLAALTGEARFRTAADGVVALLAEVIDHHPLAVAHTLLAASLLDEGTTEVVVAGDRPDLVRAVQGRWLPDAVLAWGERIPSPLWESREDGHAYVCHGYTCQRPTDEVATLTAQLDVSVAA